MSEGDGHGIELGERAHVKDPGKDRLWDRGFLGIFLGNPGSFGSESGSYMYQSHVAQQHKGSVIEVHKSEL